MDSMAVLLEAAAEDIKLIDCLGPEDLCYDPNSADGLKPLQPRALRSRRPAAAAGVAAAVKSVLGAAQDVKDASAVCTQPALKAIDITAQNQAKNKGSPPLYTHSSANAELAAALSRGDFFAPKSNTPMSQRLVPEAPTSDPSPSPVPADTPLPRQLSPRAVSKPGTRGTASKLLAMPSQAVHDSAGSNKTSSRGSSANPATRVQRFAAAILQYIYSNMQEGQQQTLESVIRREFGNTPDISKALRVLVAEKNVKRVGKGGRAEPFTYQLAAKAIKYMQELPSANSAATVAISDSRAASEIDAVSDQQAAPAAEHHAELLPHPNLQHEAIGNVQPTCAMTSQKPLSADRLRLRPLAAFSGLKRSASMPTLPTAQMVGQLPSSIFAAQLVDGVGQKASAMHRGDAELKAAAPLRSTGHQMTGQTALAAQILGAVEPNDVNAAHSMPIAVPGHWVTAASVGATAMDSSMSNSPKESTASIAIANPFAVRTNTDHLHGTKTAIAVPQSYLYTEAALRNSITSSAGNRHSSLFAHHEKENSPKPKPSHVTMPDSAPVLHETVTTLAASGKEQIGTEPAHSMSAGNSAMSGTASELALSAKHYRSGGSQIQAYSTISGDVVRVLQDPGMLQDAEGLQHAGDAANKRCRLY